MVIVDIKDRDALHACIARGLCGDGGVVEMAIAAAIVRARMMARWATQREGGTLAVEYRMRRGERGLRAPIGCVPRSRGDRRRRIERMRAEQRIDPRQRERAASADRKDVRNRIPRPPRSAPHRGRGLQEIEVARIVHRRDRRFAAIRRRHNLADRGQDRIDPRRAFCISRERPVVQFLRGRVAALSGVKESAHQCRFFADISRITTPANAESSEPVSTPIFTPSACDGSVKASPPMNRLIVKPMPAISARP